MKPCTNKSRVSPVAVVYNRKNLVKPSQVGVNNVGRGEDSIYTVGHSTMSLEEFIDLIKCYDIKFLVDVRAHPTSRRYPHFSGDHLCEALGKVGIGYVWLGKELGGHRRRGLGAASPNKAWRSEGFRNYADHMLTEEFRVGIERLLEIARRGRTVFMCAEKLWWRCHRRMISDELVRRGIRVKHIISKTKSSEHRLTSFARVDGDRIVYDRITSKRSGKTFLDP